MKDEVKNILVMELNEGIQIRLATNVETIRRYAEVMKESGGYTPFPPIEVYRIDGKLHIADGHHRWKAALAVGLETIPCYIHDGTEENLIETAFHGNETNALQMTDADLKHGREVAILKFPNKSDRELATICHCSPATINRAKRELEESGRYERPETVIGKDGKAYKSGDSVKHLKEKSAFNLDEFRQWCLAIKDAAQKEYHNLERKLDKINGYEVEEESEEERAAFEAKRETEKNEFEKKHWWSEFIKTPVDDSEIFLFSELWFCGLLYFAYFVSLKNGKPELLVKGWKAIYREIRDTETEERIKAETGETTELYRLEKPIFIYTVQRFMTPAEYLVTDRIESDPDAPDSEEPCKCNFFQELWAGRVLEEYRRMTA